jgi:hypothetical protein
MVMAVITRSVIITAAGASTFDANRLGSNGIDGGAGGTGGTA